MAYNIQEHKYGSYVLLHFETESPENIDSFERFMVLQKSILRNQTVVLDEKPNKQSEKVSSNEEDKKDLTKESAEKTTKPLKEDKPENTEDSETKEPEEEALEVESEPEEEAPEDDQSDKGKENEETE